MRVLLVDDDSEFSQELARGLNDHGLETICAGSGREAVEQWSEVDIILLDLVLPDIDGFRVCQEIRVNSSIPIIMLTGRSDEFDQVLSLKVGADDYVVKPYRLRELVARIEAVVRRACGSWPGQPAGLRSQVTKLRELRIDYLLREVLVNGSRVLLTLKEFDLLSLLASEPGRVFTRAEIMNEVWGHDGTGDTRTLGVHMVSLRRKLGASVRIETVRGLGFRLASGA